MLRLLIFDIKLMALGKFDKKRNRNILQLKYLSYNKNG